MHLTKKAMEEFTRRIACADDREIMEIMKALIAWQEKRYPDQELLVLWLPKYDRKDRLREIERLSAFLKEYSYSEVNEV